MAENNGCKEGEDTVFDKFVLKCNLCNLVRVNFCQKLVDFFQIITGNVSNVFKLVYKVEKV